MDRSRLLTWGGAGLVGASVVTLAVLTLGGNDVPEPVTLPDEVASAPLAPSQRPGEGRDRAPRDAPPVASGDEDGADEDLALSEPSDLGDPGAPPAPVADAAPDRVPERPSASAPAPLSFCFPGVLTTPDGCASRATILSFAGEAIGVEAPDGTVERLTVTLADPDDLSAPEREVGTCTDYLALKRRGWGAMTSAGMSRDLRMNRFCGLIAMAERAERPRRGGLTRLTYGLLETVPDADWPRLGENPVENPALALDAEDERLWRVETGAQNILLRDVGAADFDGDGEAEVLVHAGLAARGGTARGGGYLLAERARGGALRLRPADLYAD